MTKQLLILEEEKSIVASLEQFLEPKGYVIYIADNVRHGIEVLNSLPVNGVLLSLDMFGAPDLRMLNDLRVQHPRIPIIAMSSNPTRKLILETFAVGVRGHLSKPIVNEQLRKLCSSLRGTLIN